MFLTLGDNFHIRCCLLGLALMSIAVGDRLYDGDNCEMKDMTPGICTRVSQCTAIEEAIKCGKMTVSDPVNCGFSNQEELICCPKENNEIYSCNSAVKQSFRARDGGDGLIHFPTSKPTTPRQRPAITVCRDIEKELNPALVPSILNGNETVLGEFPHMAAIGFITTDDDDKNGNYAFRCGGTLIDKKFVLSAAHCFNRRNIAKIVRLGVVNFTDTEQLANSVTVRIKKIHIHPDYTQLKTYNDIALLQLEEEVKVSKDIAPTCLYTDDADPPMDFDLYATGWGKTEVSTRITSPILLKAKLEISSFQKCNASYVSNGQVNGLIESQLCAYDPNDISDTCEGDSGGPLNMILNETMRQYRIVGITSTGFGCGSSVAGLYTKVSAFLDYIEDIVWPDLRT